MKHWIPPTRQLPHSHYLALHGLVARCRNLPGLAAGAGTRARTAVAPAPGITTSPAPAALAKKLEYLPLALEQAAAYIAEEGPGWGFADYLRIYESHESELLTQRTPGATDYPASVYLTWRATIDKLPPGSACGPPPLFVPRTPRPFPRACW